MRSCADDWYRHIQTHIYIHTHLLASGFTRGGNNQTRGPSGRFADPDFIAAIMPEGDIV